MLSDAIATQLIITVGGVIATLVPVLISNSKTTKKVRDHVDTKVDPLNKKVDEIQDEQKSARQRASGLLMIPADMVHPVHLEPEVRR